jgi:hypothetical protein
LRGELQHLGRLLDAQAAEEAQLDHLGFARLHLLEGGQRIIQRHQIAAPRGAGVERFVQIHVRQLPAPLLGQARFGCIHQDPPHHLCGNGKEVRPVVPADVFRVHQAKIRFVQQRRGLECVAGLLPLHMAVGDAVQFFINQGR